MRTVWSGSLARWGGHDLLRSQAVRALPGDRGPDVTRSAPGVWCVLVGRPAAAQGQPGTNEEEARKRAEAGDGMTPYYEQDGITIYHGDCREVLPTIKASAVLTDPPYGIGSWATNATGGFMDRAEAKNISAWDQRPPARAELLSIAEFGPTIFWGGNYFDLPPSPKVLIWDKAQRGMHFAEAEIAWTNFTKGTTRILWLPLKSQEVFGGRSVREHPTQKPIALMTWCLSFLPDDVVLDPFMGSGTTLRAAKDNGRRAIGIELEEKYCEIAAKRLAQGVLPLEVA